MSFASTSASTKNLWSALRKARKTIGDISKDAHNDETGSSYASLPHLLDQVETALDAQDILLIPTPARDGENHGVHMRVLHLISEEYLDVACLFPLGPHPTTHQVLGCQTYGRRAILQSVLNLRVRDDDGNSGSRGRDDADAPWVTGRTTAPRTLADRVPAHHPVQVTPPNAVITGQTALMAAPAPAPVPATAPTTTATAEVPSSALPPPEPSAPLPESQPVAGQDGARSRRRSRSYAPEAMMASARELMVRLATNLGETEARRFLAARVPGCFLGTASAERVQQLITDAEAILASAPAAAPAA